MGFGNYKKQKSAKGSSVAGSSLPVEAGDGSESARPSEPEPYMSDSHTIAAELVTGSDSKSKDDGLESVNKTYLQTDSSSDHSSQVNSPSPDESKIFSGSLFIKDSSDDEPAPTQWIIRPELRRQVGSSAPSGLLGDDSPIPRKTWKFKVSSFIPPPTGPEIPLSQISVTISEKFPDLSETARQDGYHHGARESDHVHETQKD